MTSREPKPDQLTCDADAAAAFPSEATRHEKAAYLAESALARAEAGFLSALLVGGPALTRAMGNLLVARADNDSVQNMAGQIPAGSNTRRVG